MRAYWSDSTRTVLKDTCPVPACPSDSALIQTRLALAEPADERPPAFRGIPGSHFIGTVHSAPQMHAAWIGKRVAVSPLVTCASCEFCRGGAAGICSSRVVMGYEGRDGGLAELVVAPVRNLVELPPRLSDDHAVLAWSVAKAARIAAAARVSRGSFVTVLGDRPLALIVAQLLSRHCEHVRVLGHGVWSGTECERLGIRFRPIGDVGRRHDQQVVVDCSGGSLASVGSQLLRPRGLLLLTSTLRLEAGFDLSHTASREATISGVFGGNIVEGVSLLASGALDVTGMLGSREVLPTALAASPAPATLVQFEPAVVPIPTR